jgi:Zn-dependent metalloprotease
MPATAGPAAQHLEVTMSDMAPDRARQRLCPVCCFIVPPDVLRRQAQDPSLDPAARKAAQDTLLETERLRALREAHRVATLRDTERLALALPGSEVARAAAVHRPEQQLFDCQHRRSLPGRPVTPPGSTDFQTVHHTTARVVEFYSVVLDRNSVDGKGLDLVSSLHYGRNYDNAFWDGRQMVYGDGDGQLFTKLFLSPDVIAHELTHGVTQYTSALRYEGESGALNESLSDVFGAVFNQWHNGWDVTHEQGWLIGASIVAEPMKQRGYRCLRNMLAPSDTHCISPQPERYGDINPAADVHENSGVPNKAFALFARALGGHAWDQALKVWYAAATSRSLRSDATFQEFAALTVECARKLGDAALADKCQTAWAQVEVLSLD